MKLLENKIAVVTGGGSGYGRAIAVMFAEQGAKVAILNTSSRPVIGFEDDDYSKPTAEAIKAKGGIAEYIHCDVSDKASVEEAFKKVDELYGGIDILVNSAGIHNGGVPIDEQTGDSLRKIIQVNLMGSFYCDQQALRRMKAQGRGGRVIQVASTAAFLATAFEDNYDISKGGVLMLSRCVAAEYGEYGITSNTLCPATGYTPMAAPLLDYPIYINSIKNACTIPELVWPKEVAAYATFLASDYATGITGTEAILDGGRRACGSGHSRNMRALLKAAGLEEYLSTPQ